MKRLAKFLLLFCYPVLGFGQQYHYYQFPKKKEYERLVRALPSMLDEREKMAAYHQMAYYLSGEKRDSSLYYMNLELGIARRYGLALWQADALDGTAYNMWRMGDYPGALQRFLEGIKIASAYDEGKSFWGVEYFDQGKNPKAAKLILWTQLEFDLSTLYQQAGDSGREFQALLKGEQLATQNHDKSALAQINDQLGSYFLTRHQLDSALLHSQRSVAYAEQSDFGLFEQDALNDIGTVYVIRNDYRQAHNYFVRAVTDSKKVNSDAGLTHAYISLSKLFLKEQQIDSALFFARKAWVLTRSTRDLNDEATVDSALANLFKLTDHLDSAYDYQGQAMAVKDRLNGAEKIRQFQNIGFTEQLRVQQLEEEKIAVKNRTRTWAMLAGLVVVILIASILWRNNGQKLKANHLLEQTLADLKAAQQQLIQSEKLASLGELTAGIAHEIQNPLNFVNNFSDVTTELTAELVEEFDRGDLEEARLIVGDIQGNLEKITHHGKRAEQIVKGMLEHSRASTGKKEPTDLNQLITEYLQLAYHGIRAKDNSFSAQLITELDPEIPKVDLVAQEIGRVLLNLFNNSFYAIRGLHNAKITVISAKNEQSVIIRVIDNGNGIPKPIQEKIMQPFFTTKPTGEGTGLGLSLSYDIIVKRHQGKLYLAQSDENVTEFIISLPI